MFLFYKFVFPILYIKWKVNRKYPNKGKHFLFENHRMMCGYCQKTIDYMFTEITAEQINESIIHHFHIYKCNPKFLVCKLKRKKT